MTTLIQCVPYLMQQKYLFHFKVGCEIANHADGNHSYCVNKCHETLKKYLKSDVNSATTWLENNYMCTAPIRFRVLIWIEMDCSRSPSLCGIVQMYQTHLSIRVTLYEKLKPDKQTSNMCIKASGQLKALNSVSKCLAEKCHVMIYTSGDNYGIFGIHKLNAHIWHDNWLQMD